MGYYNIYSSSTTIYLRLPYSNCNSTAVYGNNLPERRFRSQKELELEEDIARFGQEALLVKLRRKEANRKAMSDMKSRQRSVPVRGRAPVGARLQTYQGALHARMAPKKHGG